METAHMSDDKTPDWMNNEWLARAIKHEAGRVLGDLARAILRLRTANATLTADLAERTRERDQRAEQVGALQSWQDGVIVACGSLRLQPSDVVRRIVGLREERDAARAEVETYKARLTEKGWEKVVELRAEVERLTADLERQRERFHLVADGCVRSQAQRDAAIRDRHEFAASEVVKFAADFLDWSCSLSKLNDLRVAAAHRAAELRKAAPATPDKRRLHGKFLVERSDGSSAPGGKHHGCEYFVLDMTHDPHAVAAVAAYADSCRDTKPELAADLVARWCKAAPAAAPAIIDEAPGVTAAMVESVRPICTTPPADLHQAAAPDPWGITPLEADLRARLAAAEKANAELAKDCEDALASAENLLLQFPGGHCGVESWLMNHGVGHRAAWLRLDWMERNPKSDASFSTVRKRLAAERAGGAS